MIKTLKHMADFQCIGPECEDTCCGGLKVTLYKSDYQRISSAFPENANQYMSVLPKSEQFEGCYAQIEHGENQLCSFVDKGWCKLHRDFGETMIPRVCATFPRFIVETDKDTEVHGLFACPEVARLCLLAKEPTSWVPLKPESLAPHAESISPINHKHLYSKYLGKTQDELDWILDQEHWSYQEQCFLIVNFLKRISVFYKQDMTKDPEARLAKVCQSLHKPEQAKRQIEHFYKPETWKDAHTLMILSATTLYPELVKSERLTNLQHEVFSSYGDVGLRFLEKHPIDMEQRQQIWSAFQERRQSVLDRFKTQVDRYFQNYCQYFLRQTFYLGHTSPSEPANSFCMNYASMKFLFFSNPRVYTKALNTPSTEQAEKILDEVIVETIQLFHKFIISEPNFGRAIRKGMNITKTDNLGSLAMLLKL